MVDVEGATTRREGQGVAMKKEMWVEVFKTVTCRGVLLVQFDPSTLGSRPASSNPVNPQSPERVDK